MRPNVIVVCWTCQRDKCLLRLHYAALRKVDKTCPVYYVFDDEGGELPKPFGENCFMCSSSFDRGGNLNGQNCVYNMLRFYTDLQNLYGNIPIVKVDADTIITNLAWANDVITDNADAVGFHGCSGYYFTGCCYCLTTKCAEQCVRYLEAKKSIQPNTSYRLPEDGTVTMLAALTGNRVKILENNAEYPLCVPFMDSMCNHPHIIQRITGCIHCGQYQRLNPLMKDGHNRNDIVKRDMKTVMRALYGRQKPTRALDIPLHSDLAL